MAYDQSPIPQGYGSLPIQTRTGNPYLDEIDQAAGNAHASLSPGAQLALRKAGAPVQISDPQTQGIQGPRPAAPSLPMPQESTQPMASSVPTAPTTGIQSPRAPIQPVPVSAQEQAQIGRLNTITAPDTGQHNRQNTGTSGINQIHNPWGRVPLQILEALGTGFAPGLTSAIPGTQLHHNMLVNQAEGGIAEQEKIRTDQEKAQKEASEENLQGSQGAHFDAETGQLIPAQATEANARAWSLLNPADKEKELTEFALWHKQNPNAPVGDWIKLKAGEGKVNNAFELWHQQNPKGTAEDWLKIETANKPGAQSEYEDFKSGYLKTHPQANTEQVVRAYAAAHQAPERAPQTLMVVPGENGAPGRAINVTAGSQVPNGAITPTGISSETVASDKAATAEKKEREELAKEYQVSRQLAANPSPTNDVALLMRFIGATKPDSLGKLRLNQQEMNLVLGTRSAFGDLEAFAQKIQTGQRLTPQQRTDMLKTMAMLAGQAGGGNTIHYVIGNKPYNIPADQEKDFLRDHPEAKKSGR